MTETQEQYNERLRRGLAERDARWEADRRRREQEQEQEQEQRQGRVNAAQP